MDEMKVPELKALAKELAIEGADGMKKADLLAAIAKKQFDAAQFNQSGLNSGPEKVEVSADALEVKSEKSSSKHDEDIAKHPKFAKFNSHGGK